MASASSSPDRDPLDSISKDGFFTNEDAALGQRIQEMDDEAVPFASQRGLQFCKYNVLDHPRIRPVLDSSFEWSALGLYRSFGPGSEVYTFDSAPESQMEILIVMLWSKESRLFFWRGAHRHWLDPVEAANSLLQVTRARLELLGLEPEEYALKDGGLLVNPSFKAII
ncbi:hypothetical protein AK830_g8149 [Neonectria ditissima]|uniref:Uncharacterized protein n=1 Tax=Neonectria ditissima TaxID=78410 RepID=A0A0P7AY52_9HYPO|nr:hypothetical protein AK830_g8149 [Neonectria ditissima]